MKNTVKKLSCIAMSVVMLFSFCVVGFAADTDVDYKITVCKCRFRHVQSL